MWGERKKNTTPPPVNAVAAAATVVVVLATAAAVVVVLELLSLGQNMTDYKWGQTTQDQNLKPHEYTFHSVSLCVHSLNKRIF